MSDSMVQRETLPIPDATHVGLTAFDAKDPNTVYPPIVPLRPPAGAPNVLIVLVDDVGFGASSTALWELSRLQRPPETLQNQAERADATSDGRDPGMPDSPQRDCWDRHR